MSPLRLLSHLLTSNQQQGFQFGLGTSSPTRYAFYMDYMERIQITLFTIQETIISLCYIITTIRLLHDSLHSRTVKVLRLLNLVQGVVIGLDIVMIMMDYCEKLTLKAVLHTWEYAVKLKLEFVVLNQVLDISKKGLARGGGLSEFENGAIAVAPSLASPSPQTPLSEKWCVRVGV